MIAGKPCILIYTNRADEDLLREICAGIEEEGILWETTEKEEDLDQLSWKAAADSMLGVGIAITDRRAAMQMRSVKKGRNVCELNHPSFAQCRILGANSARAVKKLPFKCLW